MSELLMEQDRKQSSCHMKPKIYDLYVSIGIACRPAMYLNDHLLRVNSFPLDWQMAYSLDTVLHLFETSFEDFFVEIEPSTLHKGAQNNRWVKDTKNHIISIHHFSNELKLDEVHEEFLDKMHKRFITLNRMLKEAKDIVLISNREDEIKSFEKFLIRFGKLYPHLNICLINIRTDKKADSYSYKQKFYQITDKLSIQEYYFNDTFDSKTGEIYGPRGNEMIWNEILKNYFLRRNWEEAFKFKEDHKDIVIFGAGKRCYQILNSLQKLEISIDGIAVSDVSVNPEIIRGIAVREITAYNKDALIIISLADCDETEKIQKKLFQIGYKNVSTYDEIKKKLPGLEWLKSFD